MVDKIPSNASQNVTNLPHTFQQIEVADTTLDVSQCLTVLNTAVAASNSVATRQQLQSEAKSLAIPSNVQKTPSLREQQAVLLGNSTCFTDFEAKLEHILLHNVECLARNETGSLIVKVPPYSYGGSLHPQSQRHTQAKQRRDALSDIFKCFSNTHLRESEIDCAFKIKSESILVRVFYAVLRGVECRCLDDNKLTTVCEAILKYENVFEVESLYGNKNHEHRGDLENYVGEVIPLSRDLISIIKKYLENRMRQLARETNNVKKTKYILSRYINVINTLSGIGLNLGELDKLVCLHNLQCLLREDKNSIIDDYVFNKSNSFTRLSNYIRLKCRSSYSVGKKNVNMGLNTHLVRNTLVACLLELKSTVNFETRAFLKSQICSILSTNPGTDAIYWIDYSDKQANLEKHYDTIRDFAQALGLSLDFFNAEELGQADVVMIEDDDQRDDENKLAVAEGNPTNPLSEASKDDQKKEFEHVFRHNFFCILNGDLEKIISKDQANEFFSRSCGRENQKRLLEYFHSKCAEETYKIFEKYNSSKWTGIRGTLGIESTKVERMLFAFLFELARNKYGQKQKVTHFKSVDEYMNSIKLIPSQALILKQIQADANEKLTSQPKVTEVEKLNESLQSTTSTAAAAPLTKEEICCHNGQDFARALGFSLDDFKTTGVVNPCEVMVIPDDVDELPIQASSESQECVLYYEPADEITFDISCLPQSSASTLSPQAIERWSKVFPSIDRQLERDNEELLRQMLHSRGRGNFSLEQLSSSDRWEKIFRRLQKPSEGVTEAERRHLADFLRAFLFAPYEDVGSPLTEGQALQAAQTLVDLKRQRLRIYQNNPQALQDWQNMLDPQVAVFSTCFLASQHYHEVHLDLFALALNIEGECLQACNPNTGAAEQILRQHCPSLKISVDADEPTRQVAIISYKDFLKLQEALPKSKTPNFIILDRHPARIAPPAQVFSPKENDFVGGAEAGDDDAASRVIRQPNAVEWGEERRGRKGKLEQRPNHPSKRPKVAPKGGYEDLALDQTTAVPAIPKVTTGDLPNIIVGDALQATESNVEFSQEGFWGSISLKSGQIVAKRVAIEEVKRQVYFDCKPLELPIVDKIAKFQVPDLTAYPLFNRLLKPYQVEAANKIEAGKRAKIDVPLNLDMGLGKTMVMGNKMLQRIADAEKGSMAILAPKSLVEPIVEELQRVLLEGKCTAWALKIAKEGQAGQMACVDRLKRTIKDHPNGLEARLTLEMLALLPRNVLESNFQPAFIANTLLSSWANYKGALAKHFEELQKWEVKFPAIEPELLALLDELAAMGLPKEIIVDCRFSLRSGKFDPEPFLSLIAFPNQDPFVALFAAVRLLAINPFRESLRDHNLYSNEAIQRIIDEPFDRILACNVPKEVGFGLQAARTGPVVLVTTTNQMMATAQDKANEPVSFSDVVVDEYQKANKNKLQHCKFLERWFQHLKKHGPVSITLSSATPVENQFTELWNLFAVPMPEAFPVNTHNVLNKHYKEALTQLTDASLGKDYDEMKLAIAVLNSFIHHLVFKREVVEPLTCRYLKTDQKVIDELDGMIAKRVDLDMPLEVSENLSKLIAELFVQYSGQGLENRSIDQLAFNHAMLRLLLLGDYQIANFTLQDPNVLRLLDILHNGPADKRKAFIEGSPLLKATLLAAKVTEVFSQKKNIVFVTKYKAAARIVDEFVQAYFAQYHPETRIFEGNLTGKQRTQMINWFKQPADHSKVLMLSQKAGGAGLNLGEAVLVVQMGLDWNPFADNQSNDRIVRVGFSGERFVLIPRSDNFLWKHQEAVREEKESLERFCFGKTKNLVTEFELWEKRLQCGVFHNNLNDSKNFSVANERAERFQQIMQKIKSDHVTEEKLAEFVARVTPAKPKPELLVQPVVAVTSVNRSSSSTSTARPAQMPTRHFFSIPMPYEMSFSDIAAIGLYCRQNPRSPLIQKMIRAEPGSLQQIQLASEKLPDIPHCLQVFTERNENYIQSSIANPTEEATIRILSNGPQRALLLRR